MSKAKEIVRNAREHSAVDEVLIDAADSADVIVICVTAEGEIEVKSTIGYPPDILWAMTVAQHQLFEMNSELDS